MEEAPPAVRGDRLREPDPDHLLVLAVGFLIPGAGHALLGQLRRGIAFFLIVGAMFTVGVLVGGGLYEIDPARPFRIAATVLSHGSGIFDLSARFAGWRGDPYGSSYEYGTAFILTAGVMNLLLLFDVWDVMTRAEDQDDESSEELE